MRYKLFVSGEFGHYVFYEDDKKKAQLLFRMAMYSSLFTYVTLSECVDDDFVICEWEEEKEDGEG